ncbi:MAG: hypothetical protein M1812_003583 [Candelaria pacifica]|nr:MAG: hypothetical protein M1812_003583 [Candelaria pacifica]
MTKSSIPLEISDYLILPLALRPLAAFPTLATHYLYLRQHAPKIPTLDTARSLFIVNVPIDATELHFRYLFANHLGNARVESVIFENERTSTPKPQIATPVAEPKSKKGNNKKRKRGEDKVVEEYTEASELPKTWDRELHRSGSTAVVVFVDKASAEAGLKAARKAAKEGTKMHWGDGVEGKVPALGSARYLAHHRLTYPSHSTLLSSVNAYMTTYSALETSRAAAATRARNEPDEDGFITVTRGGRTGPARQEEAQEKADKQKEKKGLEDFYRFQSREKKKERAGELVRKFQEDRERVRKMREGRGRFRPNLTHSMIIPGHLLSKLITNVRSTNVQAQPCGFDLTLKRVRNWDASGTLDFSNKRRIVAGTIEIPFLKTQHHKESSHQPEQADKAPETSVSGITNCDCVFLAPDAYLVGFNEHVNVPLDMMGQLFARSSLWRSGALLSAGVLDSGYRGALGGILQVVNPYGIYLERDARLAQVVFSEMAEGGDGEGYKGIYQGSLKL